MVYAIYNKSWEKVSLPAKGPMYTKFVTFNSQQGIGLVAYEPDLERQPEHKEILEEYCKRTGITVEATGGGFMMISKTFIKPYGESMKFGPFDPRKVSEILHPIVEEYGLELRLG